MKRLACALVPVMLAILTTAGVATAAAITPYTLPDAELTNSGFGQLSGYSSSGSTLNSRNDVAGSGVQFSLTMGTTDNGKIGLGDPWPTSVDAGLGWDPVLSHYTSLSAFDSYQMVIRYDAGPVGSTIYVSLIMNTGLTGPSGYPSSDWTNDTFWAGDWVKLALGETAVLTLDFDSAEAWNITDNKYPHTQGAVNGAKYVINDRDRNEVSSIGLQIADFDHDLLGRSVVLHLNAESVPAPAGLALLSLGSGLLLLVRRRFATRADVS